MTIAELYEWAEENDALDCEIEIRDSFGSYTHNVEPVKTDYNDVQL